MVVLPMLVIVGESGTLLHSLVTSFRIHRAARSEEAEAPVQRVVLCLHAISRAMLGVKCVWTVAI